MEHHVTDIDKYNKEMSANIADKAWAFKYLSSNFRLDVTRVIDFGCADGALVNISPLPILNVFITLG